MFGHDGFVRNSRRLAGFIGGPPFPGLLGPNLINFRVRFVEVRKNRVHQPQLFNVGSLRIPWLSRQHFSPLRLSPQALLPSSRAASNSSIVSSPGRLPQTSFSQPGFGATLPASKSSREKTGSVSRVVFSFLANNHLTSYFGYFAPFRPVFQVDELCSASTDGCRTTSRHRGALVDNQRPDFNIDKIVMPGPRSPAKLIDLSKTPMGLSPFAASVRVNKMIYLSAPVLNRKFGGVALL